jgi:hypothetical protein
MSDRADGGGEFDEDCVRVGGGNWGWLRL